MGRGKQQGHAELNGELAMLARIPKLIRDALGWSMFLRRGEDEPRDAGCGEDARREQARQGSVPRARSRAQRTAGWSPAAGNREPVSRATPEADGGLGVPSHKHTDGVRDGREGGKDAGREGGKEGRKDAGREGGREAGRETGR